MTHEEYLQCTRGTLTGLRHDVEMRMERQKVNSREFKDLFYIKNWLEQGEIAIYGELKRREVEHDS